MHNLRALAAEQLHQQLHGAPKVQERCSRRLRGGPARSKHRRHGQAGGQPLLESWEG